MASVVGICNLALSHLGKRAEVTSISPSDGSPEANLCNTFYYIARDFLLEKYEWDFATKRVALADLGTPPDDWEYRYALPSDLLREWAVYADGEDRRLNEGGHPFKIEQDASGTVLYADVTDAILHYTVRVKDTTKYSETFVVALSWLLASFLAGPLVQDLKLADRCEARAYGIASEAATQRANVQKAKTKAQIQRHYPIDAPRSSVNANNIDSRYR